MPTVVNTAPGILSTAQPESAAAQSALPAGTRLAEFEVERVLGAGGFGIVYLALDHTLARRVAIKEYMPASLAVRGKGATLALRSAADAQTFAAGLRSFINEARLLASFDHPSLVDVHRFWEENGTAYMVMPFYDGQTLKDAREAMGHAPDEAWLQAFLQPLLGALETLHRERVYHRDISPDNIMLLADGRPLLLDFGSARRVVGDGSKALTAILKPNYAPVEQYADMASFPQGPWTDLYALGAVVHYLLSGEPPMPAALRAMRDELPLLSAPGHGVAGGPSARTLAAIDWALAVNPEDRPASVAAFRQALNGEITPPVIARRGRSTVTAPMSAEGFWSESSIDHAATAHGHKRSTSRVAAAVAALVLCGAAFGTWTLSQREAVSALPTVASTAAAPAPPIAAASAAAPHLPEPTPVALLSPKPKPPVAGTAKPKAAAMTADSKAIDECADKNFVMKSWCVRRACEQSLLQAHPECRQLREDDEARAQSQLNR